MYKRQVLNDSEYPKLESPKIGTTFELNDHRGKIVGIAEVTTSSLFGVPTLYTTYNRAIQYIPNPRFTISYILVEPKTAADIPVIQQQVHALGYLALTRDQFQRRISTFYMFQTLSLIHIFLQFLKKHGEASMHVAKALSEEYKSAFFDARRLALSGSTAGRLAGVLLEWGRAESCGKPEMRLTMALTHEELANLVGCSRETMTRMLGRFKREKLIRMHGVSDVYKRQVKI